MNILIILIISPPLSPIVPWLCVEWFSPLNLHEVTCVAALRCWWSLKCHKNIRVHAAEFYEERYFLIREKLWQMLIHKCRQCWKIIKICSFKLHMIKKNFYAAFLFIAKQKLLSEPPQQWMQTPLTYKQQLSTLTCSNFQYLHETTLNTYMQQFSALSWNNF